jgi:hypothetical protein
MRPMNIWTMVIMLFVTLLIILWLAGGLAR